MSTYLELTNRVLENLSQNSISSSQFDDPPDPAGAIKRFVNEAKDTVLARLGAKLFEREFQITTRASLNETNIGQPLLVSGSAISCFTAIFDTGLVGAKVHMPDVEFDQTTLYPQITSGGMTDPTWKRITAFQSNNQMTIDGPFNESGASASTWSIYKDEYELDSSVRQVLSAWTNRGPLELVFVSERRDLIHCFGDVVTISSPTHMAISRSDSASSLWLARLWPAPADREIIRVRAKTWLEDLDAATDTWRIEPELERIIQDEATVKALRSPLHNDPDLAVLNGQDTKLRTAEWRNENTPRDPSRRLRRVGPGEERDLIRERRIARVGFTTT